jgi:hypothetical protein
MEIERSREKNLRRQFEYIVYNVKVSSFFFLIRIKKKKNHVFQGIRKTSSTTLSQ